ncbi:MAG: Hpt domain-containing protein [Proteobacteria bacterium]|nr:Hpt domain-containing protein [Pseudomonadota bacterium]
MDPSFFGYSLEDFKDEARELLSKVEAVLTGIKEPRDYPEGVNAIFRSIHSLKGSAAYAGLKDVHSFAHLYESFLGELRNRKIDVDDRVLNLLIRAKDYLEDLVFSPGDVTIVSLDELDGSFMDKLSTILKSRSSRALPARGDSPEDAGDEVAHVAAAAREAVAGDMAAAVRAPAELGQSGVIKVTITAALKSLVLALKNRPFQRDTAIKAVKKLEESVLWAFGDKMTHVIQPLEDVKAIVAGRIGAGELSNLQRDFNNLAKAIKGELDSLSMDIKGASADGNNEKEKERLGGEEKKSSFNTAFDVQKRLSPDEVRGVSEDDIVKITLTKSLQSLSALLDKERPDMKEMKRHLGRLKNLNQWAFEGNEKVGNLLLSIAGLLDRPFNKKFSEEIKKKVADLSVFFPELLGEKRLEKSGPTSGRGNRARGEAAPPATSFSLAGSTLRVKSEDLESLMKTVGSLRGLDADELEKLQSQALQLRMVPVGELFSRFPKVVRDLSESLDKEITLEMSGESVKLDKVIVDKIQEPILHMIRNAAGHGVESSDEMARSGKRHGVIRLGAYHEGGQVIIEVSDNGRGISLARLKERGLAMGLIQQGEELDRRELLNLIFAPGFSTTDEADGLSGRGVGMDVVRDVVTSLQGAVTIETKEGEGSTFRLILPLTLAIVRALILEEGGNKIGVPAASVDKVLSMTKDDIQGRSFVDKNRLSLDLKEEGETVPLVNFSKLFGVKSERDKRSVVIIKAGPANRVALVVDFAEERRPLTVQPLDRFAKNSFFSSASLVDEKLIMILNVPSLLAA